MAPEEAAKGGAENGRDNSILQLFLDAEMESGSGGRGGGSKWEGDDGGEADGVGGGDGFLVGGPQGPGLPSMTADTHL